MSSELIRRLFEEPDEQEQTEESTDVSVRSDNSEDDALYRILTRHQRLQWQKSRPRRANKKELKITDEYKLVLATGSTAASYLNALKNIGHDVELGEFHLDKGGFSPEIVQVLGPRYLDNYVIIATPEQKNCQIYRANFSFLDSFLNQIFSEPDTLKVIEDITLREALYGTIDLGFLKEQFDKYLTFARHQKGFRVELSLDSVTKSVERISALRKRLSELNENSNLLLDDVYVGEVSKEASALMAVHPGLAKLRVTEKDPRTYVFTTTNFKTTTEDSEVYCFKDKGIVMIYFTEDGQSRPGVIGENYAILNGNRREELLDYLFSEGYITTDIDRVRGRLVELTTVHYVGIQQTDFTSLIDYVHAVAQKGQERMPELFYRLQDVLEHFDSSRLPEEYYKSLPLELKLEVISPAKYGHLVHEIIARVNASDQLMEYRYNPDRLKKRIAEAADEGRAAIIQRVLDCIEFTDQYNADFNSWLKNSYPTICEKLGIVFTRE